MADTYGVTVTDVAEELPGLFPVGFSPATAPSAAQVASFISTGDTLVTLRVKDATGGVPSASDAAAPLAKRYVINWVLAQVVKIVYAGNDPARSPRRRKRTRTSSRSSAPRSTCSVSRRSAPAIPHRACSQGRRCPSAIS
jgi:hypothetical protein